jgi:hypothetical protein
LEDFEKGVRELVGAPHPQVWDEINKEHMQRGGESTRKFKPGNYDTETCSMDEFLIVIDPAKGKEASKGKRCALRLSHSVDLEFQAHYHLVKLAYCFYHGCFSVLSVSSQESQVTGQCQEGKNGDQGQAVERGTAGAEPLHGTAVAPAHLFLSALQVSNLFVLDSLQPNLLK